MKGNSGNVALVANELKNAAYSLQSDLSNWNRFKDENLEKISRKLQDHKVDEACADFLGLAESLRDLWRMNEKEVTKAATPLADQILDHIHIIVSSKSPEESELKSRLHQLTEIAFFLNPKRLSSSRFVKPPIVITTHCEKFTETVNAITTLAPDLTKIPAVDITFGSRGIVEMRTLAKKFHKNIYSTRRGSIITIQST